MPHVLKYEVVIVCRVPGVRAAACEPMRAASLSPSKSPGSLTERPSTHCSGEKPARLDKEFFDLFTSIVPAQT